jgi:PleD family two-component response regulator
LVVFSLTDMLTGLFNPELRKAGIVNEAREELRDKALAAKFYDCALDDKVNDQRTPPFLFS